MANDERIIMAASDGHIIDPAPEQEAYDVCAKCGKAIGQDIYGRGLVTLVPTGNPECYGR